MCQTLKAESSLWLRVWGPRLVFEGLSLFALSGKWLRMKMPNRSKIARYNYIKYCTYTTTTTTTTTTTQPFYGPLDFVRDYPGELVPET